MSQITVPKDIEKIFRKPGRGWTPPERDSVINWLSQLKKPLILTYIGRICQKYGGYEGEAAIDQAEDLWQEFCTPPQRQSISQLDKVIRAYDPTGADAAPFPKYLLTCLQNFCRRKMRKERKRQEISFSELLSGSSEGEEEEDIELEEIMDPQAARWRRPPEKYAEKKEFLSALERCLNNLRRDYKIVWILCDIEGRPYQEVVLILNRPLNTVKGWLHRARLKLRECLREKGYDEEGWLP